MSSGRSSSSSRAKKKRAYSDRHRIEAKKKINSPAANFLAMLAGMVASLIIIAFVVNYFTTDRTPRTDVIADEPAELDLTNADGITEFDDLIQNGSEDRIYNMIRRIAKMPLADRSVPFAIDMLTRQCQLCSRMLEMTTDEIKREYAIQARIKAAMLMYGIDQRDDMDIESLSTILHDAAAPYTGHSNAEIAKSARLAMVKLSVFEFARNMTETKFETTSASIINIVDGYPEDIVVSGTLRLLLEKMSLDSPDYTTRVLDQLDVRFSDQPQIVRVVNEMRDVLLLNRLGYEQIVANYWANGENGRIALLETTMQLISQPDIGVVAIDRVEQTIDWLEKNQELDLVKEIGKALVVRSGSFEDQKDAELANRIGSNCLQRIAQMEKKFTISGPFIRNAEIEDFNARDQVKVLLFWTSTAECKSIIDKVAVISGRKQSSGIATIAIGIDPDNVEYIDRYSTAAPRWWFLIDDPQRNLRNRILEQYPVHLAPHIMLVDRAGKIRRINIPVDELENEIDDALSSN